MDWEFGTIVLDISSRVLVRWCADEGPYGLLGDMDLGSLRICRNQRVYRHGHRVGLGMNCFVEMGRFEEVPQSRQVS